VNSETQLYRIEGERVRCHPEGGWKVEVEKNCPRVNFFAGFLACRTDTINEKPVAVQRLGCSAVFGKIAVYKIDGSRPQLYKAIAVTLAQNGQSFSLGV